MGKETCLFCDIARRKVESRVVYEDDFVMAILDKSPASRGHVILFPKRHYKSPLEMEENMFTYIYRVAQKLSNKMLSVLRARSTSLFMADGLLAGQNIEHPLLHIIPFYENEKQDISLTAASDKEISPEDAKRIADKFMKELRGGSA